MEVKTYPITEKKTTINMLALTYIGVTWEALPTVISSVYKQDISSLI